MGRILTVALITAGSFIAGILLAPKSGKETREDIKEKINDYSGRAKVGLEEVKDGAAAVKDQIADSAQSMKDIATDAVEDAKRTADRVKTEATNRTRAVSGEVDKTTKDVKKASK